MGYLFVFFYFMEEETEAWQDYWLCPRSHNWGLCLDSFDHVPTIQFLMSVFQLDISIESSNRSFRLKMFT